MPFGHSRRSVCTLSFGALVSTLFGVGACSSREGETNAAKRRGSTPSGSPDATTPSATPSHERDEDAPAEACPTAVPGTSVRARDVEGGAALEVTTTGDVAAVRARARVLAEHHGMRMDEHARMHGGDPRPAAEGHGPMGPGPGPRMEGGARGMAGVQASVEDIDGGARIVLTPRGGGDRDEVEIVRAHARRIAERMASGRCPQMMM